jgi:methionine-rich copper-binding protein CopC
MRMTRDVFMKAKKVRAAMISAAAFAIAAFAISACGELTGPESPSTPTNVVATLTSATSATVTWTPSPLNDGVISYTIYRNGNKVGESATTSFNDTGLAQQTTYVYSVAANCKGGVISDRSAETTESTITTVDITRPTVSSVSPFDTQTGVSGGATVTATFSEPMDPQTINTSTILLNVTNGGAAVQGTVSYNATTRIATFTPAGGLINTVATQYSGTITTGAKDLAGNALQNQKEWKFTTADQVGPTVTSTNPVAGATGVPRNTTVQITFSEALDPNTVNATNITMRATASGTAVPGGVTYNPGTRTATFTPTSPLSLNTGYTVTVSSAVKDAAGNTMPESFSFAFGTVADTTPPTVTSVVPATGTSGVALNTTVKVTFSEPMDGATITTSTFTLRNTATSALITATVAYDGTTNSATLTPSAPLASNTGYTVTVTTGAKDAAGNALASSFTSTFTTLLVDSTPPTIVAVLPTSGATNIRTDSAVSLTFSEAIDQSTITATTVSLKNTNTSAVVVATLTYDVGTNKVTLRPNGPLSNSTSYTLTITTGIKDLAGNALASNFTSSFTTAAVTDNTAPTVVSRTPSNGTTNVATNTNITITFSEAMDLATINSTNITIKPTAAGSNLAANVSCNSPCTVATIDPSVDLLNNTSYTVTVSTGVKDVAGNALAASSSSTFTTIPDTTPPQITATSPANGATGVSTGTAITATFNEDMSAASITAAGTFTLRTTVGAVSVTGTVSYNAVTRVATFTPSVALLPATGYTATITTAATDTAGNPLAINASFSFTTAP